MKKGIVLALAVLLLTAGCTALSPTTHGPVGQRQGRRDLFDQFNCRDWFPGPAFQIRL